MRRCLLVFSGNHVYIRAMFLLAILYIMCLHVVMCEGCPGLPSTVLSCTKLSIITQCIVWYGLYRGRVVGIVSCRNMSMLVQLRTADGNPGHEYHVFTKDQYTNVRMNAKLILTDFLNCLSTYKAYY